MNPETVIKSPTELEVLHRQWLELPITKQLAKLLDKHTETIADAICVASKDVTEEGQRKLQQLAVQLNTTRTIRKLAYDTSLFTQNSQRASNS